MQDFRGDVRAVVSPSSGVLERERYGLTGRPEAFPAADVNFDGKVNEDDNDDFDQALLQYGGDTTKYDPRADLDRDGDVDNDDQSIFSASYSFYAGYGSQWRLSAGAGLAPGRSGGDAGLDNRFGWRGYWYDPHLRMYHVRNRAYDPRQGQFLQTDPLGFSAGDQNLYRYADGNFSSGYDPLGLRCVPVIPGHPENGFSCNSDDPCPGYEGLENFHGPSNNNDLLDNATNFFGGYANALTFGGAEHLYGGDMVDHNSGAYRAGVVTGAVAGSLVLGGAAVEVAIARWGLQAGSTAAAMLGGTTAGVVGDVYFQSSMIATGMQDHYSAGQTLAMGALGGYLGYAIHGIVDLLRATPAVDMVAARAAQAAAEEAAAAARAAGGGGGAAANAGGACGAATNRGATFGNAATNNYRATFFQAHPELEGKVVVHHAVEQQVLDRFPGVVTESQIHSLENLRGIPYGINSEVHLSQIRIEWNRFYKPFTLNGTSPTATQLLQKATEIDTMFGPQFMPPVGN